MNRCAFLYEGALKTQAFLNTGLGLETGEKVVPCIWASAVQGGEIFAIPPQQ